MQFELPLEMKKAPKSRTFRRCVRRVRLEPDAVGTYTFRARSFTREKGRVYRCRVNPRTGFVWCNCRDFTYRKAPQMPTYEHGPLCKHLERAVRTIRGVEKTRGWAALAA